MREASNSHNYPKSAGFIYIYIKKVRLHCGDPKPDYSTHAAAGILTRSRLKPSLTFKCESAYLLEISPSPNQSSQLCYYFVQLQLLKCSRMSPSAL